MMQAMLQLSDALLYEEQHMFQRFADLEESLYYLDLEMAQLKGKIHALEHRVTVLETGLATININEGATKKAKHTKIAL